MGMMVIIAIKGVVGDRRVGISVVNIVWCT